MFNVNGPDVGQTVSSVTPICRADSHQGYLITLLQQLHVPENICVPGNICVPENIHVPETSVYLKTFMFLKTSVFLKTASVRETTWPASVPVTTWPASVPETTWPTRAGSFICRTHLQADRHPSAPTTVPTSIPVPLMSKTSTMNKILPQPYFSTCRTIAQASIQFRQLLYHFMGSEGLELICAPGTFTGAYATAVYSFGKSMNALSKSLLRSCSYYTAAAQYDACTNHLSVDQAQTPPKRVPKQVLSPVTTLCMPLHPMYHQNGPCGLSGRVPTCISVRLQAPEGV